MIIRIIYSPTNVNSFSYKNVNKVRLYKKNLSHIYRFHEIKVKKYLKIHIFQLFVHSKG